MISRTTLNGPVGYRENGCTFTYLLKCLLLSGENSFCTLLQLSFRLLWSFDWLWFLFKIGIFSLRLRFWEIIHSFNIYHSLWFFFRNWDRYRVWSLSSSNWWLRLFKIKYRFSLYNVLTTLFILSTIVNSKGWLYALVSNALQVLLWLLLSWGSLSIRLLCLHVRLFYASRKYWWERKLVSWNFW
jgi:hypothetical protein